MISSSFWKRSLVVTSLLAAAVVGQACANEQERKRPMLPDEKEVIYSFLSVGKVERADEALNDVWDIGPRAAPVKLAPITWNDNPHDKYWRFIFYGLRPLSNLVYAYYTTGNAAYRDKIIEVLRSYTAFDAMRGDAPHEFLDDPHTSAFRAMMLVNLYGKLTRTNDLPEDLAEAMRPAIEKLGTFLAREEHFEADQNLGFNEAAALLVIGVNFPEMRNAMDWRNLALDRLSRLMENTVDTDGVEIENSPFYHFYVLTFLQQDSRWMERFSVPKPVGFDDRIAKMFEYATYGVQPNGFIPLLGSSVTLNVHKLAPHIYSEEALEDMVGIDEPTPTFTYVRSLGGSGQTPTERNKRFPVSGQGFLRSAFSPHDAFKNDTFVSFNTGNHRSNHNHRDSLGITLYSNGKTLLPDAGLFEYDSIKSPQPFPQYFKSTRAHNAVFVDGLDQSITPKTTEQRAVGGAMLEGSEWLYQSGRHGLYEGVSHRRSVLVLKRDLTLVFDTLQSAETHNYVQAWHLSPDASPAVDGLNVIAADVKGQAELAIHQGVTDGVSLATIKGQESPVIQGFYSDRYGNKVPNTALEYGRSEKSTGFATLLATGAYSKQKVSFTVTAMNIADGSLSATVCVGEAKLDVSIANQVAPGESVSVVPSEACR